MLKYTLKSEKTRNDKGFMFMEQLKQKFNNFSKTLIVLFKEQNCYNLL